MGKTLGFLAPLLLLGLFVISLVPASGTEINYLPFYSGTPAPTPTPTPPASLVGAYDYVGNSDTGGSCPEPLPTNAKGCAISIKWARVEPTNGGFDWSYVDNILNSATHPDYGNASLQLTIQTGMVGTPDMQAVCDSLTNPTVPTCTPWLSSITGVNFLWDKAASTGNNIPCSTPLLIPDPTNTAYQAAYAGLVAAAEAHFKGNPKISYIGISPISFRGSDLSMGVQSKPGNACGVSETTNSAWASLSGCATNSCFETWARNAFDTLWYGTNGTVNKMNDINTELAWQPNEWPAMTGGAGAVDSTTAQLMFNDALAHQPSPATFSLFNETWSNSSFSCNQLTGVINQTPKNPYPSGGLIGQAVNALKNDCTSICQMGTTYGPYYCNSIGLQVYSPNFSSCDSSIGKMNLAYAGTQGETCP